MLSSLSKAIVVALLFGSAQAFPTLNPRQSESTTDNTELLGKLITDPSAIKRFQRLLTVDGKKLISKEDLVKATTFDFNKDTFPVPASQGGIVASANIESFPILFGSGLNINLATTGPCGVLAPHVHPRANEFFFVIDGEIEFGYTLERGLLEPATPLITGKVTKSVGTLFPQGSIHYQINTSCKPMAAVTFLNSDDPGTTPVLLTPSGADATTKLPRQVGPEDFETLRPLLPPQIVSAVQECFARCEIA